MFKLYQVVSGKPRLIGYNARGKLPLVAAACNLPALQHKNRMLAGAARPVAYADGRFI